MANYRRELNKIEYQYLLDKYKKHKDAVGGIFTPQTRRRLLGIKAELDRKISPDTADFWYDVRKTVKNSLKDLELICEVANPEQLQEIFTETLSKDEKNELNKIRDGEENQKFWLRIPSLQKSLTSLFKDYFTYKKVKVPKTEVVYTERVSIDKDDAWKATLAFDITKICLNFFKEHNLVTSISHKRLVEEVEDMLDVEMGHAHLLPRDRRNVKFV